MHHPFLGFIWCVIPADTPHLPLAERTEEPTVVARAEEVTLKTHGDARNDVLGSYLDVNALGFDAGRLRDQVPKVSFSYIRSSEGRLLACLHIPHSAI